MSSPWTVALLLCLSFALSAAYSFQDISMTVSQFEREGHRIAVQIDSKTFAGIAIYKTPSSGWMFSKINKDDLFAKELAPVFFIGRDQRVGEQDKNFLLITEDYFILQRTSMKDFKNCDGENKEPFHLVDGSTTYYLMAVKENLNDPTSEKIIGTFTGNIRNCENTKACGTFYGLKSGTVKKTETIATSMYTSYAEVFCVKKPKDDWK